MLVLLGVFATLLSSCSQGCILEQGDDYKIQTVEELLKTPEKYNNCKVHTAGYVANEAHYRHVGLFPTIEEAQKSLSKRINLISKGYSNEQLKSCLNSNVTVLGVFIHDSSKGSYINLANSPRIVDINNNKVVGDCVYNEIKMQNDH